MSMSNIQMYSAVLPRYESKEDKKNRKINADDPRNREEYMRILFGGD